MTISISKHLRVARDLINEGGDMSPKTGVWITRISGSAFKAQAVLTSIILLAMTAHWLFGGQQAEQWALVVLVTCTYVISAISTLLAKAIDDTSEAPPSNTLFFGWCSGLVILGLPMGHAVIFAAEKVQSLEEKLPHFRLYYPAFLIACLIVFSLWRLIVVRQWFSRLSAETDKRQKAEQGQATAQAQLRTLQAQIEPHFLFNTLAGVQHLVRNDPKQADFLLGQLITYLREAIPDIRSSSSTLGREFSLVQAYLQITKVRMGPRLSVVVNFDEALRDLPFPALVVHTLVENAIQHGLEPKIGPVLLEVSAKTLPSSGGNQLEISVVDNGVGFGAADHVGTGLGLRNVRDRLALSFHGLARLDIADRPEGGVCARILVPRSFA